MVVLNDHDVTLLTHAWEQELSQLDPMGDAESFVLAAHRWAAGLSQDVRDPATRFRRFSSENGGLMIGNIPVGQVPATPASPELGIGLCPMAVSSMMILLSLLGEPVGYRPEFGGLIYQVIVPVKKDESEQISTSSKKELYEHVDGAFSEYRSDYVALLAITGNPEAGTTVCSSRDLVRALSPETVRVLRQERFKTKVDKSFLRGDNLTDDIWIEQIRIFDGPEDRPLLRVDFGETAARDGDDEAEAALVACRQAVDEIKDVVYLDRGQMLVSDNRRCLHGRTVFEPRYDGTDRFLLRAFVVKDLTPSEHVRPRDGRIIDPDYSHLLSHPDAVNASKIKVTRTGSPYPRPGTRGY